MQGTYLNTVTYSQLFDLIRKSFVQNQQMIMPQAQQIFIKDPVGKNQGNTKRYDEVDTQTFARTKREGSAAKKARVGIGYNVTMTKKRIAMEIDISQEARDENRHPEVGALITNLVHYCPQRIELDLTHRLTFSNATSYTDMDGEPIDCTVGDGLALISSVHTLKFSSTTYSNSVSGNPIFSKGGLESAEQLTVSNILSNFGERRVYNFNTIITSDDPNTCNTVKQFLRSTSDTDQNNPNVVNVYQGKYRHIELPYLATTAVQAFDSTKRRWWFLASIGNGFNSLQAYYGVWEEPHMKNEPEEGKNNVDFSRDIWSYGSRAGYGIVIVAGRGIVASQPTS